MTQQQTSININSKYFIDRVENDIVQLTKTISLEYGVSIETAKIMARQMIQSKLNQILTDAEKKGIKLVKEQTHELIKANIRIDYAYNVYELLKTFELN